MGHIASARTTRAALALLAALACLTGCGLLGPKNSPSGPVPPSSTTVTPGSGSPAARPPGLAAISWPADGVSAAGVGGSGVLAGPGATRPVPIASVAKLMTAYVVLHDHPLSAEGSGPEIVVQPPEAAAYPAQARDGDSLVPVAAGERLTERQALTALLLPSADNMAWILARWDAGTRSAFVARMNAAARRLGMTGTRYTDPSGLDPSTTSTAADQVRLGMAAMGVPALAAIVSLPAAMLPVAGIVRNFNTLLGRDGIVGLKTGSTQAAGGCVLIAAWHQPGGHQAGGRPTLIVAAAFGQPGTAQTILPNALQAGDRLVLALDRALGAGGQSMSRTDPGSSAQRPHAPPPGGFLPRRLGRGSAARAI